MLTDILSNHRGPFRFCVSRPDLKKDGFYRTEWLPGCVDKADVVEEAHALLTDPRDVIANIAVYSETEQSAVTVIRVRDLEEVLL